MAKIIRFITQYFSRYHSKPVVLPGKKLTQEEAQAYVFKKYDKALSRLADH